MYHCVKTQWTATFSISTHPENLKMCLFSTENNAKLFLLQELMDEVHKKSNHELNTFIRDNKDLFFYFSVSYNSNDPDTPHMRVFKRHARDVPFAEIWKCLAPLFKGVNTESTIGYSITAPVTQYVDTGIMYHEFYSPSQ